MNEISGLDRFVVLEEVASSEAEVLVRARDKVLDREVLLKLPGPGVAQRLRKRTVREQALREARALARVRHPGVVRLHDVIETPQGPLLVLEPIVGERLAERLEREKRLPIDEAVELGRALADALAAVHAEGVVHRGLSAAAVVLADDGQPILTGFELAKLTGPGASMSATSLWYPSGASEPGRVRATEPYAPCVAPEQMRGESADARCDVFAVGWLLFEAIAGCPPYELDEAQGWTTPRELRAIVPDAPRELARVLTKALATSPLKRYDSAAKLRDALAALGTGGPKRSRAARPTLAVAALGAVLVAAVAGPRLWESVTGAERRDDVARNVATREEASFEPGYRKRHALVIGIGAAYAGSGYPPLSNAEADVDAIVARLESLDDEWVVEPLVGEQASRRGILNAVARVSERAESEDSLFIYFAGHGERHERASQSGWILPADARRTDRADWIRFDEFARVFSETRAKHVMVAMDCCYSGRLAVTTRGVELPEKPATDVRRTFDERYTRQRAHVVLASGRANEAVVDGVPGQLSPFARAFLDAFEKPPGSAVTHADVMSHILQTMAFDASVSQVPVLTRLDSSGDGGYFVFHL